MRLIPAPYRILALVLLALACIGFGYVQGLARESDRRDAQALEQTRAGVTTADKESTRREAVGAAREVSREKIRVVYRTIKESADANIQKNTVDDATLVAWHAEVSGSARPYNDCGLDADGLRLWNAANSGDAAPLSGEPDYTLPAAATGQIGKIGGLAIKPHRNDGAGGAVPGPVGEAGGVRP